MELQADRKSAEEALLKQSKSLDVSEPLALKSTDAFQQIENLEKRGNNSMVKSAAHKSSNTSVNQSLSAGGEDEDEDEDEDHFRSHDSEDEELQVAYLDQTQQINA